LHLARSATLIRPVRPQDGDTKDMPMEKIAIHVEDLPPPPQVTPDAPDEEIDQWLGNFFGRMVQPEPEAAPVDEPPRKPRAEAKGGGIGVDITVGKDGKVSLVAKPVGSRQRSKGEADADQAEDDAPRSPTVTSTADQRIKVDPGGVIEVAPREPGVEAPPPKDEPDDLWHDLDLGVLESEPNRPAPGISQE
jgi:hypothetical protein